MPTIPPINLTTPTTLKGLLLIGELTIAIPSIMLMIMISLTHTLMAKFMFMLTLMQGSKQSKPSMPPFSLLLPLDH